MDSLFHPGGWDPGDAETREIQLSPSIRHDTCWFECLRGLDMTMDPRAFAADIDALADHRYRFASACIWGGSNRDENDPLGQGDDMVEVARGTAVVTGASSGIGLAAVEALAADGWQVVATARNPDKAERLREIAAGSSDRIELGTLDVTDPGSVTAAIADVIARHESIELLVNNAGAGHRGTLEQLSDQDLEAVMDLNYLGVARCTREVLPGMRELGRGRIITVTSLNGVVAMPFSDAYNASKFAVEGLMEGLAPVMRQFGVHVSVLEPGPVQTAFLQNAGGQTAKASDDDPYGPLLDSYNATMASLSTGSTGESAEHVGQVIAEIARDPAPALRYQSDDFPRQIAGQKLVDPTGESVVAQTSILLQGGVGQD
ncbi:MAG: SDR family oxidoreductase [Microthrixaceae bacterium]